MPNPVDDQSRRGLEASLLSSVLSKLDDGFLRTRDELSVLTTSVGRLEQKVENLSEMALRIDRLEERLEEQRRQFEAKLAKRDQQIEKLQEQNDNMAGSARMLYMALGLVIAAGGLIAAIWR